MGAKGGVELGEGWKREGGEARAHVRVEWGGREKKEHI